MEISDRLELKIVEAVDLDTVDGGANPDPYVDVTVGLDTRRTKHVSETRNPVWNSPALVFTFLLANNVDEIFINIKSHNQFTGNDVIIGSCSIPLATVYNSPKVEIDDWYNVVSGTEGGLQKGKIRLKSFYVNELGNYFTQLSTRPSAHYRFLLQILT